MFTGRNCGAEQRRPGTRRHYTSVRRAGFTLIELLSVIAIIAILSSMLMPTFSRVREMGRRTVCQANLKQLGMGFQLYSQDYDGKLPGAGQFQKWGNGGHWVAGTNSSTSVSPTDPTYGEPGRLADIVTGAATGHTPNIEGGALFTYLKNSQIFRCPSNQDGEVKHLTYSMNCAVGGIAEPAVQEPASIILLMDEEKANDAYVYAADSSGSTDTLTLKHNDGGNLLLMDGHVKFYPFRAFTVDNSLAGRRNKISLTNTPRFYDAKFGPSGFYEGGINFGSCYCPLRTDVSDLSACS